MAEKTRDEDQQKQTDVGSPKQQSLDADQAEAERKRRAVALEKNVEAERTKQTEAEALKNSQEAERKQQEERKWREEVQRKNAEDAKKRVDAQDAEKLAETTLADKYTLGTAAGVSIEGHPRPEFNGEYTRDSTHDGWPVLKNAKGIYCYRYTAKDDRYTPTVSWYLNNKFTPNDSACIAHILAKEDQLPVGAHTWQIVVDGAFVDGTLTLKLLVRSSSVPRDDDPGPAC